MTPVKRRADDERRLFDALYFRRFGLAFGDHVVLSELSWELPPRGLVHLVGPASSGKTTLARVLARHQIAEARCWGELCYGTIDWRVRPPARLVSPEARLVKGTVATNLMSAMPPEQMLALFERSAADPVDGLAWSQQQLQRHGLGDWDPEAPVSSLDPARRRLLALLCAVVAEPRVIVLDELERDLDDAGRRAVRSLAARASQRRLVIVLAREGQGARALGGRLAVLAGGHLQEQAEDARAWWHAPKTELGRRLVAGQSMPAPPVAPAPPPAPTWLQWVIPGHLAGMPRPGRMRRLDDDLSALREQGIQQVVTLEEEHHHQAAFEAAGFGAWHLPIADMATPRASEAIALGRRICRWIDQGQAVVLHCREGLGRTGTMLAVCLMLRGYTAGEAMGLLRQLRLHYVQSETQLRFVEDLQQELAS